MSIVYHIKRQHPTGVCRTHGLGCDTLIEGYSLPLTGYVMNKANAGELRQFPRLKFRIPDLDPEAISSHPPFCYVFKGEWPNIRSVPIWNDSGSSSNLRGRGRGGGLALMYIDLQERRENASHVFETERDRIEKFTQKLNRSARSRATIDYSDDKQKLPPVSLAKSHFCCSQCLLSLGPRGLVHLYY